MNGHKMNTEQCMLHVSVPYFGPCMWMSPDAHSMTAGWSREFTIFSNASARRLAWGNGWYCMRSARSWQEKVSNAEVLSRAGLPSMYIPCLDCATSTSWRLATSQKTLSMESWYLGGELPATQSYNTRMPKSARGT